MAFMHLYSIFDLLFCPFFVILKSGINKCQIEMVNGTSRGRADFEWFASVDAQHYVSCISGTKMRTTEPALELVQTKPKWLSNLIVLGHGLKVSLASLLLFTELPGSLKKKSFNLWRTGPSIVSVGRFSHGSANSHGTLLTGTTKAMFASVANLGKSSLKSRILCWHASSNVRFPRSRSDLLNLRFEPSSKMRAGTWSPAGWPNLCANTSSA